MPILHAMRSLRPALAQCPVKIESRRDQRQVAKCLWRVAQLLTRARNLFREDMQVISKAQHILKDGHRLYQVFIIVCAGLWTLVGSNRKTIVWKH